MAANDSARNGWLPAFLRTARAGFAGGDAAAEATAGRMRRPAATALATLLLTLAAAGGAPAPLLPHAAATAAQGGARNVPAVISSTPLVESELREATAASSTSNSAAGTASPFPLLSAPPPPAVAAAGTVAQQPDADGNDLDLPAEFRGGKRFDTSTAPAVPELLRKLMAARPPAWQLIAGAIANGRFSDIASLLVSSPFDDVRGATVAVPWVLLRDGESPAAVAARKAALDFGSHVDDLDRAAANAAAGSASREKVQQAFFLMSASLDSFIGAVPSKYASAAMKAQAPPPAAAAAAAPAASASAAASATAVGQ